jgi:DNA-binding CsgD family transcriptional regulator
MKKEAETKQPRFISAFLGLGFYWAWVSLLFFADWFVPSAGDTVLTINLLWAGCTAVHVIALIAAVLLSKRLTPYITHSRTILLGSALMALGTACIPLSMFLAPIPARLLLGTSIVLSGFGGAIQILIWGTIYSRLHSSALFIGSFGSYAVMGLLQQLTTGMTAPIAIAAAVLMPLLSGLTLLSGKRQTANWQSVPDTQTTPPRASVWILPILLIFFFAFCGELLRGFSLDNQAASIKTMGSLYHVGGAIGATMLLIVLLPQVLKGRMETIELTLAAIRPVLLIMAAAFILVSFFDIPFDFSYAFFSAGFHCFRALAWIIVIQVIQKLSLSPLQGVGTTQAAIGAAPAISSLLASVFRLNLTDIPWDTVSLAFLFAMFSLATLLFSSKPVRAAWDLGHPQQLPITPIDNPNLTAEATIFSARRSKGLTAFFEDEGLSAREIEVAHLLARGRSLPFIKEELTISLATAQTHQRHIYQKLNVRSRQEFLTLIDKHLAEKNG